MKVSYQWLKSLVDIPVGATELAERFDLTGTAVEAVVDVGREFDGVVIGEIVAKERHPDADRLWVTRVDVGADEPLQIVCGAQNFEAGDRVYVATVGSVLPGDFEIKKSKLRGVVSEGMNCSGRELGVDDDADGLLILPADAPIGMGFAEHRGIADTILELEITPNRPDCMSVLGIARETGAIFDTDVVYEAPPLTEAGERKTADSVTVTVDPERGARYTARVIRGVKVGPSPAWLARAVESAGSRSINNIVDVTNYVLYLHGQPLHTFDLGKLATDASGRVNISVRPARVGETLVTLDDAERSLTSDMTVIADDSGPIALAGVMGGADSEVTEATVDILLESATFSTSHTSRTSRNLGLVSEASLRYERGVDAELAARASDIATALIVEVAGGVVEQGIVDEYPVSTVAPTIPLRAAQLTRIIGEPIDASFVENVLGRLGCSVVAGDDALSVTVPTDRPDLTREIDLVEEVLRLWGMDRIAPTLPVGRGRVGRLTDEQRHTRRVGELLRGAGLNETMTYALCAAGDPEALGMEYPEGMCAVEMINPMSSEQSHLRLSLLPGLLRSVSYNLRRKVEDVHLYEIGRVYLGRPGEELPSERERVAGVLTGAWGPQSWSDPRRELDLFDGKGVLETLFDGLGIQGVTYVAIEHPWLQKGRSADVRLSGDSIGWVGEVDPTTAEAFDVEARVVAFELDLEPVLAAVVDVKPYVPVPRFPAVEVDAAFVVDASTTADELIEAVKQAGGKSLESVRVFDVYEGEGIEPGKKSIALALAFRDPEKTLAADDAKKPFDRIVRRLEATLGAKLRG